MDPGDNVRQAVQDDAGRLSYRFNPPFKLPLCVCVCVRTFVKMHVLVARPKFSSILACPHEMLQKPIANHLKTYAATSSNCQHLRQQLDMYAHTHAVPSLPDAAPLRTVDRTQSTHKNGHRMSARRKVRHFAAFARPVRQNQQNGFGTIRLVSRKKIA